MGKKQRLRIIWILCLLNVICVIGIFCTYIPRTIFNHNIRQCPITDLDEYINVKVEKTGGWKKDPGIPTFKDNKINEQEKTAGGGQTYTVIIENKAKYQVSYWDMEVIIPENGYINKAWNGTILISQFSQEYKEYDLMNANVDLSDLEHTVLDRENLIPVVAGDKFKYIPSEAKREYPITGSDSEKEIYNDCEVGFIFYYFGEGVPEEVSPEFTDVTITYRLQRDLSSYAMFWVFLCLTIVVEFILAFFLGFAVKLSAEEKRRAADEKIINESMNTFVDFIDSKDPYTNGHSRRVAQYSKLIAQKCGMSSEEQLHIYRVAIMHDCGKIAIPDGILNKPTKLTNEEYEIIKKHTTIGANILKNFTSIPNITEGSLYHHERYDGTGYPEGLKGEEIPEVARIIAVADAFDAMNSDRCYRNRLSKEEILEQLKKYQGIQFDPKFAKAFLELIDENEIEF